MFQLSYAILQYEDVDFLSLSDRIILALLARISNLRIS